MTANRQHMTDRLAQGYSKREPNPTQEDITKYRTYLGTLADWQISTLYDTWLKEELKTRFKPKTPKQQQPNLL